MTLNDLQRASPAKLNEYAKFYGLRTLGKQNIYWARKSATHPLTKKEHFFKWSTKTADLRTALLRAVPKVENFLESIQTHLLSPVRSPSESTQVNFAKVKELYLANGTGLASTRKRNVSGLERIIATAYPELPADDLLCGVFTARMARMWQQEMVRRYQEKYLPKDVEGFERSKRSCNSSLAQAQSVFSRRMISRYEDAGLVMPPSVREFAGVLGLDAAPPAPPKMLSDEVVAKILETLPALKIAQPGVWATVILMYHGGLRNSEAEKARWSWVTTVGDTVLLAVVTSGDFMPKGTERMVALDKAVVEDLATVRIDEFIVPAKNKTERKQSCARWVNDYLSSCGVEKLHGKVSYRLRSHAVSTVILRNGIDAAQEFAGHAQRSTTMRHYKGVAVPYAPIKQLGSADKT